MENFKHIVKTEFLVDDDFNVEIKEEQFEGFITDEEESRTEEQDWNEDIIIHADSDDEPSTSSNSFGNNFSNKIVQKTAKRYRTTNRNQFSQLVKKMKENPDIAQNSNIRDPEEVKQFWEEVQEILNNLGPPIKSVTEWRKVWSDHKCHLKKKLMHNTKELKASGGGPSKIILFTAEEEDVLKLMRMKVGLEAVKNSCGFSKNASISQEIQNSHQVSIEPERKTDDSPTFSTNEGPARKKICFNSIELEDRILPHPPQTSHMELLRKQIQLQDNLYKNISKVVANQKQTISCLRINFNNILLRLDNLCDENKNLTSTLNALSNEHSRHNKTAEKIAQEKLLLKKKTLEVEIKKLELKETKRKK